MAHSDRYNDFLTDKQAAFQNLPDVTIKKINNHLKTKKTYAFLSKNKALIQQEFDHLSEIIKHRAGDSVSLQSYYYGMLLNQYYIGHGEQSKADDYRRKSTAILPNRSSGIKNDNNDSSDPALIGYNTIGQANMQRIDYTFSRISVKQVLISATDLQDNNTNVIDMLFMIDAPAPIFNAFSVGLFAIRLLINLSQIVKHALLPTKLENDDSLTAWERAWQEICDRQYHLLNDFVWGTANLFCNYNAIFFNMSDLFINQLTAILLVFDLLWLMWSRHLIEEAYLIKKEQYKSEQTSLNQSSPEYQLLQLQLNELEKEWQKSNAEYLFSISAAVVFMASFSATLLLATPTAVAFCYLMCTIAIAMYMSAGKYADYQQQSFILNNFQKSVNEIAQDNALLVLAEPLSNQKNLDDARNAFIFAMIKNTVVPLFITTCFAVCWPVALAGTIIYVSNALLSSETKDVQVHAANDDSSSNDDDDGDNLSHAQYSTLGPDHV